jgi:hypothetical protein
MALQVSNTNLNSLSQPSRPQEQTTSYANKKFNLTQVETYAGNTWTNTPAITNLFSAPYETFLAASTLFRANSIGNEERIFEAAIRLSEQPISFLNGVGNGITYLLQLGVFFKVMRLAPYVAKATLITNAFGLGVCAFESLFESLGIYQAMTFRAQYILPGRSSDPLKILKSLKDRYLTINPREGVKIDAAAKRRFPKLSEADLEPKKEEIALQLAHCKASNLANRVQPWFVHEIKDQISPLIDKLTSPNAQVRKVAHEEAAEMFKIMDIQVKKKLLVHVVGLAGIFLIGLGVLMSFCPHLLFMAVFITAVGGLLTTARNWLALGFWKTRGWKFEASECVPRFFKTVYQKILDSNQPRQQKPLPRVITRQLYQPISHDLSQFLPKPRPPLFELSDFTSLAHQKRLLFPQLVDPIKEFKLSGRRSAPTYPFLLSSMKDGIPTTRRYVL